MPKLRRIALLAVTAAALPAPAAVAGTASVTTADSCAGDSACTKYQAGYPVPVVTYADGAGERNVVVLERLADQIVVRDTGAPVTATAPCVPLGTVAASCPWSPGTAQIPGVAALLGAGDDVLTVMGDLGTPTRLVGADGDDALTGGAEADSFDGEAGADLLDGGAGDDTLSFVGTTAAVEVDLAAGTATGGDRLAGIERVVGGNGPDRLRGGSGAEVLAGGGGADVVTGGAGADEVHGEVGDDRLDGGAGRDRIVGDPPQGDDYYTPLFRPGRDVLRGGRGDDVLEDPLGRNVFLGGAGADRLEGGEGRDRFAGGSGADRIDARDERRERVGCGSGVDRATADRGDRTRGCERVYGRRARRR